MSLSYLKAKVTPSGQINHAGKLMTSTSLVSNSVTSDFPTFLIRLEPPQGLESLVQFIRPLAS